MKSTLLTVTLFFGIFSVNAQGPNLYSGSQADRDSLTKTSILLRAAFSKGDVNGIMAFHHPDVIKALDYNNYQVGAAAVRAGIKATLENYHLEFIDNKVESLIINGNTAIEQTLFAIKGTPKSRGKPFIFKGRTIVVYLRYIKAPLAGQRCGNKSNRQRNKFFIGSWRSPGKIRHLTDTERMFDRPRKKS